MLFSSSKAKVHQDKSHDAGHGHHDSGRSQADVDRAYQRGRREERARHPGHPILALFVFLVAVMGAGMVILAASQGSFTRGGQVLDRGLAGVAEHAWAGSRSATVLVADAGQTLKQNTLRQNSAQN